ncbi:MAG: beta-class carbonic anhydrase [Clostridium sp.]|uniref:beta-class carbonic anhydrase n=1 Tax=Clostridium chrysemydis TaxID=2665504 RepID=UPI003EE54663
MRKLDKIIEFNKKFVKNEDYKEYETSKVPKKKLVILSCMDTRLTQLLPKAMNIKNGDAKIIKNAGATVMHPFGSIMRSILIAVYEFDASEILVVGHSGCGMCNLDTSKVIDKMLDRGIKKENLEVLESAGIDIKKWLHGFDSVEESVKDSVNSIKNHPLMPKDNINIHGLVMDPKTGKLDIVINGYK